MIGKRLLSDRSLRWLALLAAAGLVALWQGPQWLAFARGVRAYLYGYPLVLAEYTSRVSGARFAQDEMNRFMHVREFPGPDFKDVVAPNADTLYSVAWLDLSRGPVVLHLPETQGRWLLMQVLDAWSNAIASPGTRTLGSAAADIAIVGPGWSGALPAGVRRIDCPTRLAWLIGRTNTAGKTGYAAVHQLQDRYTLTPLAPVAAGATLPALPSDASPVDTRTPVVTQVARLDAEHFFGHLARMLESNPPQADDAPMLETLRHLGVTAGHFDASALSPATRAGLDDAVRFVRALFEARSPGTQGQLQAGPLLRGMAAGLNAMLDKLILKPHNGWVIPLDIGRYGDRYTLRALVALIGFGANAAEDAVYPMTQVDGEGHALDGTHRYRLHFARDALPPAGAFWSLTMYDERGFFVANPIERYAIGDRDRLALNADGSLDLLIQRADPGPAEHANWLPAPAGRFKLAMRIYDPKPAVLEGRWVPPGVQRLD